jgi:microcystin-dependent protein
MALPHIGEIRIFAFGVVPQGWRLCDGSLLRKSEFPVLYDLLGQRYGGTDIDLFGLPDLRGRVPVSYGPGYAFGQSGGEETHVLAPDEVTPTPVHTHTVQSTNDPGATDSPSGNVYASAGGDTYGALAEPTGVMNSATFSSNPAHENMQPYLTLNFCIAVQGITPPAPIDPVQKPSYEDPKVIVRPFDPTWDPVKSLWDRWWKKK